MKQIDLRALRERLGFTQQEVADRAKISRSYYATLETNGTGRRRKPSVNVIKQLADVLNFAWNDYFDDAVG